MTEKPKIDMAIYNMQASITKTLANPIRLAILHTLRDGEKSVNELTDILGISQSNLSQHLALMRQIGIVKTRKQGTSIFYSVTNPKINQACDMVREVLLDQLRQRQELVSNYPSHTS
ncbi:MAG: metalloregulator ArsR/SmtB family transcription factor [Candidatus Bathyarchaeota archaeon]|nr:metalloregulator ArsR/SmtB family transcription factor [Candidatus Bathyarchaeota archaeon]